MRDRILEQLKKINEEIVEDTNRNLLESGILDSFSTVKVVVAMEDAFGVEIDIELVTPDNFRTAESIIRLMEDLLAQ